MPSIPASTTSPAEPSTAPVEETHSAEVEADDIEEEEEEEIDPAPLSRQPSNGIYISASYPLSCFFSLSLSNDCRLTARRRLVVMEDDLSGNDPSPIGSPKDRTNPFPNLKAGEGSADIAMGKTAIEAKDTPTSTSIAPPSSSIKCKIVLTSFIFLIEHLRNS